MIRNILLSFILIIPGLSFADVYVSEVAWMGDGTSANNEWLELFNDGTSDVSLDGWSLRAVDGSPDITLSGSIASGEYFILERTSDESVSGVSADLIYSGALANTGEVLVLSNNGSEVDRVDGSGGWSIGGDNGTKETLQRSGSGWKTAAPTPRAGEGSSVSEDTEETNSSSESSGGSTEARVYGPAISIEADTSVTGYVGNRTTLSATAFDKYGKEFKKAVYVWSFGDGGEGVGKSVAHTYVYPGTYQAVVHARYGMWEIEEEVTVSILAAPISVVRVNGDAVVLINESSNRVDMSGWHLVQQGTRFTVPDRTFVLAGAEVAFPHSVTGFRPHESVGVVYSNGVSAVSYAVPAVSNHAVAESTEPPVTTVSSQVAAPGAATRSSISVWVYVFGGLLLVGVGSIVYLRRYG